MATYNGHNEDSSGNILLGIGNGMTATVETGSTASQAYTKGALLFFNNRLCKASKAISSGATLAVGTNLTQTSLGAEITSHLRSSDGKEFYFDVKDGTYGYYPSASKVSSEFVPFGGTTAVQRLKGHTIRAQEDAERYTGGYACATRVYIDGVLVSSFDSPGRSYTDIQTTVIKTEGTDPIEGDYVIKFLHQGIYTGGYSRRMIIQVNGFDWYTSNYVDVNSAVDSGTLTF